MEQKCEICGFSYITRDSWQLFCVTYLRGNNGIIHEWTSFVCDKCNPSYELARQSTRVYSVNEPSPKDTLLALKEVLKQLVENDTNYNVRDGLVFDAMKLARQNGFQTSIYIDEKEGPDWPVFAIVLPDIGQVAWHMKNQVILFDGHSTPEKLARCLRFARES